MLDRGNIVLLALLAGAAILFLGLIRARNPRLTVVTVGPLFLFLVGNMLGAAQLYTMGAMLLGVCVLSYLYARRVLRGIAVERFVPGPLTVGDAANGALLVRNNDSLPKFFLKVSFGLPPGLEAERESLLLGAIWPGQQVRLESPVRAVRRGCYELPPIRVTATDPLGVFHRRRRVKAPGEILVYPRHYALPVGELLGENAYGSISPRQAVLPGHGLDFHSLREYQPGDDLRRVDWKTSARIGKLIVTEYEPTVVGDLLLLLDTRPAATAAEEALEHCVSLAASAAVAVLTDGGRVILRAARGDTPEGVEGRGPESIPLFLDALARIEPGQLSPTAVAAEMPAGESRLLISTVPDDSLRDAVFTATDPGRATMLILDSEAFAAKEHGAGAKARRFAETIRAQGTHAAVVGPREVAALTALTPTL